jgi:hypothetical protein
MVTPFRAGQTIAWRNCARDASGDPQSSYAAAMTVVRDEPHDLVLYRAPGYPMGRRNADLVEGTAFRHPPVIRYLDGWRPDPDWGHWRVLLLMKPDARHAVSLFWDAATGRLDFWYIDLIGPVQRRPFGFDFIEHGLDIVVEPDLSRWRWKDEDELEWAVRDGRYSRVEADGLYREGERAVERLTRESATFERWRTWRAPVAWQVPAMPSGWDAT